VLPGRILVGAQIPPQVYVAKFSPDLSRLLWATYLGGAGYQSLTGLAVDASGNVVVTGLVNAPDFPVSANALQSSGGAFVAKISGDGTQLLASTFFGNGATFPRAIAVDAAGTVYLAGGQVRGGLVTTPGSLQAALPGNCTRPRDINSFVPQNGRDGFVTKISGDLSSVVYSTYLTGTCGSDIFDVKVDAAGVATLVGGTYSLDFPATAGAMFATPPGTEESGFLSQLSADGGSLIYSTFLGGGAATEAHAVIGDSAGNWYVTGGGTPAPTPGAAHRAFTNTCPAPFFIGPPVPQPPTGGEDAFVMVFNAHSASPIFTATMGGGCLDAADSIALDGAGNIWVAGTTTSSDLPSRARVGGLGAGNAGFLASFSPDGSQVLSSSYTGNGPRLVAAAGNVKGASGKSLAAFDAVSAPSAQVDELTAYSDNGPVRGVAPGRVIRLTGRNFGPAETVAGTVADGRVTDSIAGVQVLFDGVAAPLLTLQDQSIELVVPFEVTGGLATTMQVTRGGVPVSNPVPVGVGTLLPDVLLVLNADGTANSAQHPAPVGSTIGIFVTGMGVQSPALPDGFVPMTASSVPVVYLGPVTALGQTPVQPSYVGVGVGLVAGIVQVNVTVPPVDGSKGPVYFQSNQFSTPVYVSQ
jgi:uncharacterized protein (TIGR03437 family)